MKSCLPFCNIVGKPSPYTRVKLEQPQTHVNWECRLKQKALQATHGVSDCDRRWHVTLYKSFRNAGGKPHISNRFVQHLPFTEDQQEKLFTPTDDVLRHFMWCERKSVRTCQTGSCNGRNCKRKRTVPHNSSRTPRSSQPLRNREIQTSDDCGRVYRSATEILLKRPPLSNNLSREIVSSFLQTGGQTFTIRVSIVVAWSRKRSRQHTAMHQTATARHPPQKHHKCGWQTIRQFQTRAERPFHV